MIIDVQQYSENTDIQMVKKFKKSSLQAVYLNGY